MYDILQKKLEHTHFFIKMHTLIIINDVRKSLIFATSWPSISSSSITSAITIMNFW